MPELSPADCLGGCGKGRREPWAFCSEACRVRYYEDSQERGGATGDRLEAIKQGLKKHRRQDDFGGFFLTAEGEFGWPGSHIDWLIAQLAERDAQATRDAVLIEQTAKALGLLKTESEAMRGVVEAAWQIDQHRDFSNYYAVHESRLLGELRKTLAAHRPHHAVDAHTEATQGSEGQQA